MNSIEIANHRRFGIQSALQLAAKIAIFVVCLGGCGELAKDDDNDTGSDRHDTFDSDTDAGNTDADDIDTGDTDTGDTDSSTGPTCGPDFDPNSLPEDYLSSASVYRLTSPFFDIDSIPGALDMTMEEIEAMDTEKLSITYNGVKINYTSYFETAFQLCTGPALLEIKHDATGEFIGSFEWEAESATVSDPGAYVDASGEIPKFTSKVVAVFGEPGDFSAKAFVPDFNAPPEGRWRFHVVNGMSTARMSARIVSGKADGLTAAVLVSPDENPTFEAFIVEDLAPEDVAVVDVDHPHWSGPEEEVPFVVLEYWFDDSADRHWYDVLVPAVGTETGMTILPDGTINFLIARPDRLTTLGGMFFTCRDPYWTPETNCGDR
jgi:hypothetical protein